MYNSLLLIMFAASVLAFIYLSFFKAPYGRHYQNEKKWGASLPNRLGWIIMESPSVLFFLWVYSQGQNALTLWPLLLLFLWQFHYIYRSYIFPFKLSNAHKRMPVIIIASSILFNCFNSYLNAKWLSDIGQYSTNTVTIVTFTLGCLLFFTGFYIHYRSDDILIHLRDDGSQGYKIPNGFLFEYVSSPNYLGELITWIGFYVASHSPAALLFVGFTLANLLPRSLSHLKWYQNKFPDFPRNRKALIPFVI